MAEYRIYITDSARNRIARVDDWQELTMVPKFNDVGKWTLRLPADSEPARLLTRLGGIAVERNGVPFFSGARVDRLTRSWQAATGIHTREFSGSDDNAYLAGPLALPVPSGPPYATAAFDEQSGPAETLLKHYVDVNLGPNTKAERRIAGLTIEDDKGRGATLKDWARFDTLLGLLRDLALRGGGLGFRVSWTGTGLEFRVYEPADVSNLVIFSKDNGTLEGFEAIEEVPAANHVIAGGSGDGTARVFVETSDPSSIVRWGRRIERFIDQQATSDTGELFKACQEELARNAERISITLQPAETAGLQAFRDYNLGDRVRVDLPDQTIIDIVRSFEITVTPDGETIRPVIGTPESLAAASPLAGMFARMRELESRLSALERR